VGDVGNAVTKGSSLFSRETDETIFADVPVFFPETRSTYRYAQWAYVQLLLLSYFGRVHKPLICLAFITNQNKAAAAEHRVFQQQPGDRFT
jgi:hypothetical protein